MAYLVIAIKYYYGYCEDLVPEELVTWIQKVIKKLSTPNREQYWSLFHVLSLSPQEKQQYYLFCEKYIFKDIPLNNRDAVSLARFFSGVKKEFKKTRGRTSKSSKRTSQRTK